MPRENCDKCGVAFRFSPFSLPFTISSMSESLIQMWSSGVLLVPVCLLPPNRLEYQPSLGPSVSRNQLWLAGAQCVIAHGPSGIFTEITALRNIRSLPEKAELTLENRDFPGMYSSYGFFVACSCYHMLGDRVK